MNVPPGLSSSMSGRERESKYGSPNMGSGSRSGGGGGGAGAGGVGGYRGEESSTSVSRSPPPKDERRFQNGMTDVKGSIWPTTSTSPGPGGSGGGGDREREWRREGRDRDTRTDRDRDRERERDRDRGERTRDGGERRREDTQKRSSSIPHPIQTNSLIPVQPNSAPTSSNSESKRQSIPSPRELGYPNNPNSIVGASGSGLGSGSGSGMGAVAVAGSNAPSQPSAKRSSSALNPTQNGLTLAQPTSSSYLAASSSSTVAAPRISESADRQRGETPKLRGDGHGVGHGQTCAKCELSVTGQFVRALGTVFHLDCFKCQDCGKIVAAKFFPVDGPDGKQYPLCETDYFRRLNLLCAKCGQALRGSYITALDMKFHVEHFTCSVCPTVFGPQDSYYEHAGEVYCHFHYSTRFAVKCTGCRTAILKQFVEINRNSEDEHWHPECYMIHKFWNIKLAPSPKKAISSPEISESKTDSALDSKAGETSTAVAPPEGQTANEETESEWVLQEKRETPSSLKEKQKIMEEQVYRIWTVLSTFEESSAACISEMLRHVSNGHYIDGVRMAEKFVLHVEVLFSAIDELGVHFRSASAKEISYVREARMLCKKIVNFFSLLSHTHETGARKMSITQELLSLVTHLAHYLKILIRIALTAALRLEREFSNKSAIGVFLGKLDKLARDPEASKPSPPPQEGLPPVIKPRNYGYKSLARAVGTLVGQGEATTDLCEGCRETVEEECARFGTSHRWHLQCLRCYNCRKTATKEKDPPVPVEGQPGSVYLKSFHLDFREPRLGEDGKPQQVNGVVKQRPGRTYCHDCTTATAKEGFEYVTRLEQYAFLLCVALNKLYALLKHKGVVPSSPPFDKTADQNDRSISETYRDSSDIKRMKSVNLDRKLSTTARVPKRSHVVESPSGRSAQPNDESSAATPRSPEQRPMVKAPPPPPLPSQQPLPAQQPLPPQQQIPFPREKQPRDQPREQRPTRDHQPQPPAKDEPPLPTAFQPPPPNATITPVPVQRPTLGRNTTAVRIVDEQYPDGLPPKDDAVLGSEKSPVRYDKGITLADLPQVMQAEQAREQHRPLPRAGSGMLVSELSALEFFILKHVAALTLANEDAFRELTNIDDLLEIIDSKKNTFWGKLFKGGNDKKNVKKKGVFGIPLEVLVERQGADSIHGAGPATLRVPTFIEDCISAMKQMDMSVEGVFRKNGNIRRLKDLSEALDRDSGSVDLTTDNPVQLAALLKKFLRDLPDPLLTFKLHSMFCATTRIEDDFHRRKVVHLVCLLMPKYHRDTMEVLFVFLKWVASFSHVDEETGSKMDLQNLATVICPNILYAKGKDPTRDETSSAIRVVNELLEYQDEFWVVPEELASILRDPELFANPSELTSKDVLKRCENWLRTRGKSQGRGNPGDGPTFRTQGSVPTLRADLHSAGPGQEGPRSAVGERPPSWHFVNAPTSPAQRNRDLQPGPAGSSPTVATGGATGGYPPQSSSYGSPPNGSSSDLRRPLAVDSRYP